MAQHEPSGEDDAFALLERQLHDAGMTLTDSYSSSSVQGRDGDTVDHVHRTHALVRDGRRVGELIIDRWSRKARLVRCDDALAASVRQALDTYVGPK